MRSLVLALSALVLAACGSPIVGAECRDGFTDCDGECIDLANDADHCGACDDGCGEFSCADSQCTTDLRPSGDGDGDGDGDRDGGTDTRDAGESPIGTGNPFDPDASFNFPDPDAGGCPIGQTLCEDECANTNTSFRYCGGCDVMCLSNQLCALGVCVDRCELPLHLCDGACVDYEVDPFNCGSCGHVCESGICEAGECADALSGHVIVIGHDYRTANTPMQRRIAVNALFTQGRTPVRAVFYGIDSSEDLRGGLRDAIDTGLKGDGRTWEVIGANPYNLSEKLLDADVLLIAAQDNATDQRLLRLGRLWSRALVQFVARGGVIALFETQTSNNAGTFQILEPSGLFAARSRKPLRIPVKLVVDVPGFGVATGATAEGYLASRGTVSFQGLTSDGVVLISSPAGDPVVIQRIISP